MEHINKERNLIKLEVIDLKKENSISQEQLVNLLNKYEKLTDGIIEKLDRSEKEKNAILQSYYQSIASGDKNDVYSGYIIKALHNSHINQDTIKLIIDELNYCFDTIDESQALTTYREYLQGG